MQDRPRPDDSTRGLLRRAGRRRPGGTTGRMRGGSTRTWQHEMTFWSVLSLCGYCALVRWFRIEPAAKLSENVPALRRGATPTRFATLGEETTTEDDL